LPNTDLYANAATPSVASATMYQFSAADAAFAPCVVKTW
jgi:hypothetical protein